MPISSSNSHVIAVLRRIALIVQPLCPSAQVHRATLHDGRKVALKIQYPGVARSIESDVDNLLRLISYANILPKGLYVEAAAKVHTPRARSPWLLQCMCHLMCCSLRQAENGR